MSLTEEMMPVGPAPRRRSKRGCLDNGDSSSAASMFKLSADYSRLMPALIPKNRLAQNAASRFPA